MPVSSASAWLDLRCPGGEIARTSRAVGYLVTLPLELQGQTTTVTMPVMDALGTPTIAVCLLMMPQRWAPFSGCSANRRARARVSQGLI